MARAAALTNGIGRKAPNLGTSAWCALTSRPSPWVALINYPWKSSTWCISSIPNRNDSRVVCVISRPHHGLILHFRQEKDLVDSSNIRRIEALFLLGRLIGEALETERARAFPKPILFRLLDKDGHDRLLGNEAFSVLLPSPARTDNNFCRSLWVEPTVQSKC